MDVRVKLNLGLEHYLNDKNRYKTVQVEDNTTIRKLIKRTGIPLEDVCIIMVNGKYQKEDYRLKPDDIVSLFPPIGGG
ncbi:MAG TPA: MoaD/ThiS family protein [Halanaerobiales bacterium]|nr:MoaD/ThiS family protein [Halanaerobiales bacterium]